MKYLTKAVKLGGSVYAPIPKIIAQTLGIKKGVMVYNDIINYNPYPKNPDYLMEDEKGRLLNKEVSEKTGLKEGPR